MESVLIVALWALSVLVALFVGGYLKSYLSKKGENLATHEDIDNLVEQVRTVTQTTKEIEAKISNEVWDRQKHWELKRDALIEMIKRAGEVKESFTKYHSVCLTNSQNRPVTPERTQKKLETGDSYLQATAAFDSAAMIVGAVCTKPVYIAALTFSKVTREIFLEIQPEDSVPGKGTIENFTGRYLALYEEIRKALGVRSEEP